LVYGNFECISHTLSCTLLIIQCVYHPWNADTASKIFAGRQYRNSGITIQYESSTWTRKLSIQLNLAHIARN